MQALVTDGRGRLWSKEVTPPECGDYDCLVRTEACLFCHTTDRHIVEGTFLCDFPNPSILGHESVGVVEQTGAGVRHFAPGDRVLRAYAVYPGESLDGCGSAWGGFAQFGKVRDARAMLEDGALPGNEIPHSFSYMQRVPAEIALEDALLMITEKEILSATAQIPDVSGRRYLIAGAGITACFFGLFLKLRGARRVTMTARRQTALDFALVRGVVDDVCLLGDAAALDQACDGLVETTGSLAVATDLAPATLKPDGTVYSYAVYPNMQEEGFFGSLEKVRRFRRIDPREPEAHDEVIGLIRAGRLPTAPFVTARFPLKDYAAAWRTVLDKTSLKTALFF